MALQFVHFYDQHTYDLLSLSVLRKHKLYHTRNGSHIVSYSCFQLPKSSTSSMNSLEDFACDINNTGQSMYHATTSMLMPNNTCINPTDAHTYQYGVDPSIEVGYWIISILCDDNHNINSQQPWSLPCPPKKLGRNYHYATNSTSRNPNCMGERRVY